MQRTWYAATRGFLGPLLGLFLWLTTQGFGQIYGNFTYADYGGAVYIQAYSGSGGAVSLDETQEGWAGRFSHRLGSGGCPAK